MFCGGKHNLEDCNKRKKAEEAKGRAAQVSNDSAPDAPVSEK